MPDYRIIFPDGQSKALRDAPVYNWRWQLWHNLAEQVDLSRPTRIKCSARFLRFARPSENPDLAKAVIWGLQSRDERMVRFFNLKFEGNVFRQELTAQEGAMKAN